MWLHSSSIVILYHKSKTYTVLNRHGFFIHPVHPSQHIHHLAQRGVSMAALEKRGHV